MRGGSAPTVAAVTCGLPQGFTPCAGKSRDGHGNLLMRLFQARRGLRTSALLLAIALAGCASVPKEAEPAPEEVALALPPTVTRGEFTLEADKLDTWNAVGQIVVNTPGLEYIDRSQMLDLYTVRYRGEEFLVLTKALLLSDTIRRTTTRVTAATKDGKPVDSDAVAGLLAQLQEKLPAAIADVREKQAAEKRAKAKKDAKKKTKKKKR
jgi:hypothetical protein